MRSSPPTWISTTILLRVIEQDGEELLADIDDEQELNRVYEQFIQELFDDEDEE